MCWQGKKSYSKSLKGNAKTRDIFVHLLPVVQPAGKKIQILSFKAPLLGEEKFIVFLTKRNDPVSRHTFFAHTQITSNYSIKMEQCTSAR